MSTSVKIHWLKIGPIGHFPNENFWIHHWQLVRLCCFILGQIVPALKFTRWFVWSWGARHPRWMVLLSILIWRGWLWLIRFLLLLRGFILLLHVPLRNLPRVWQKTVSIQRLEVASTLRFHYQVLLLSRLCHKCDALILLNGYCSLRLLHWIQILVMGWFWEVLICIYLLSLIFIFDGWLIRGRFSLGFKPVSNLFVESFLKIYLSLFLPFFLPGFSFLLSLLQYFSINNGFFLFI